MSPYASTIGLPRGTVQEVRKGLLRWYDQNRRDLPWRRTRDPYAIWIAETMLQQTQVKTVLPYYRRFLRAFPTLRALDRAPIERVLTRWSGLGYYRRAENLKAAARKIAREHGGRIPQDFETLCALPGIGSYTAGALMSIAYNQPYPALDGNGRRVLGRVFATVGAGDLRKLAHRLVPPSRPGEFNQAIMDLGATVCLSGEPKCRICPLARSCVAKASGVFHRVSTPRPQIKDVEWPLALIVKNGKVLLRRRPSGALLGGLWEVPGGQKNKGESIEAALARHLNGVAAEVKPLRLIEKIRHHITRHRIKAPLFTCACDTRFRLPDRTWRWVPLSSVDRYPLSSLSLKALRPLQRP